MVRGVSGDALIGIYGRTRQCSLLSRSQVLAETAGIVARVARDR